MNKLSFVRRVLYTLKKDYGYPLDIYKVLSSEVDQKTGIRVVFTRTRISVRKAILLPSILSRKFSYDLSYIAANKNFTYGANYDLKNRIVIVDAYDLPHDFQVVEDDYVVIGTDRYSLKTAELLEHRYAYVLTIKDTVGSLPYQVLLQSIGNTLNLGNQVQVAL